MGNVARSRHFRHTWSTSCTESRLEEFYLLAIDLNCICIDKLGSPQYYVNAMLLAKVFSGIMYCYLSPNLSHPFHDFGEVHLDSAPDLQPVLFRPMPELVRNRGRLEERLGRHAASHQAISAHKCLLYHKC